MGPAWGAGHRHILLRLVGFLIILPGLYYAVWEGGIEPNLPNLASEVETFYPQSKVSQSFNNSIRIGVRSILRAVLVTGVEGVLVAAVLLAFTVQE